MVKPHCSNPRARSEIRSRSATIARAERLEERTVRRGRLTDVERAERDLREDDFQLLVTGLAEALGWSWMHVRPGLRSNGRWWTATTGPLAKWPDLVLVRERDRRLVFAELKRELKHPTPEQAHVIGILSALSGPHVFAAGAGSSTSIEVHVWRPSDLRDPIDASRIYEALR